MTTQIPEVLLHNVAERDMCQERLDDHSNTQAIGNAIRHATERGEARAVRFAEEQRIAALVNAVVNKRLLEGLTFIALVALGAWKGWIGICIWVVGLVAWTISERWLHDRKPGVDPDSAEDEAETFVRHSILADLHDRGEHQWQTEDGKAVVADHVEWHTFWLRMDQVVSEFELLSPKDRRARVAQAMRRSRAARIEMNEFAKAKGLQLIWWATLDRDQSR